MMKDLEKMMMMGKKNSEGKLSPEEMQAKMDVLKELLGMAQEAMGSKVKGGMDEMQKVSVMAPDQKSLTHGLDMAKEIAQDPKMTELMDEDKEESLESPEEKKAEELDPTMEDKEESLEPMMDDESIFGKRSSKKKSMYDDEA